MTEVKNKNKKYGNLQWHIHGVALPALFPGQIGFWKCWFLRRSREIGKPGENPRSKEKTDNKLNTHMASTMSTPGFVPFSALHSHTTEYFTASRHTLCFVVTYTRYFNTPYRLSCFSTASLCYSGVVSVG